MGVGTLPLADPFATLFQGELKRGVTLDISGRGGVTSLGLALAAAPAQAGSWVAVTGHRSLGLAAVDELGVPLDRVVLVERPQRRHWASVTAALLDAFDLVLVFADHRVSARDARRLSARARERSNVLVRLGGAVWPEAADLTLHIEGCEWHGLGSGHGALRSRCLNLTSGGRRAASRPRRCRLWLPDADGRVRLDEGSAFLGELLPPRREVAGGSAYVGAAVS